MPRIIKNITKKQLVFVPKKLGERPYNDDDYRMVQWSIHQLNRHNIGVGEAVDLFMRAMELFDPSLHEIVKIMNVNDALVATCAAMSVDPAHPEVRTDVVGQLSLHKVIRVYFSYLANRIDLDLEQRKGSTHANQAQRQRAT